mmetsp:Transcript_3468/g.8756  ORF Transcript_3468/g.8756 Transcript_3468/m.8756 type:complete len:87 (+) Transcript_3468:419-679(+)
MSIAYQQTDGLLGGAPRHEMTEYERRKSKAEKQAMDAVQISERRASLGAGGSSFKRNLARKSSGTFEPHLAPGIREWACFSGHILI